MDVEILNIEQHKKIYTFVRGFLNLFIYLFIFLDFESLLQVLGYLLVFLSKVTKIKMNGFLGEYVFCSTYRWSACQTISTWQVATVFPHQTYK